MEFTFEEYRKLLTFIIENGYEFASYSDYRGFEKPCILRHDVDYSLEKAVKMSYTEEKFRKEYLTGSKEKLSTYFVLLKSDFYNIHSKQSLEALDRILNHGNDIGLHFDIRAYEVSDMKDYVGHALEEAFILGRALGRQIEIVSYHCPTREVLESDLEYGTLINAYDEVFFREFKYISDSSMRWREDPYETIRCGRYKKLHLLTHAFWYSDKNETKNEKVKGFIRLASSQRFESYCVDEPSMREILSDDEDMHYESND